MIVRDKNAQSNSVENMRQRSRRLIETFEAGLANKSPADGELSPVVNNETVFTQLSDFETISRQILNLGDRLRFQARGDSMAPFIKSGDLIIVEPCEFKSLHLGDIVFYKRADGRLTVHRIVRKIAEARSLSLVTRGDNQQLSDATILADQVLGKVIFIESNGRSLELQSGPSRLMNALLVLVHFRGKRPVSWVRRGLTKAWWIAGARR